jgi:hypothetical protein
LHYACNLENHEVEEWLLSKGIHKSVMNKKGMTPYDNSI